MSDDMPDWEKKYWAQKQKQKQQGSRSSNNPNAYTRMPPANPEDLPHFSPADIAKQVAQQSAQGVPGQNGWKDIDPMTAMLANQGALAARGTGPQTETVMVKPGSVYYKAVQAENFGSTMPLVKNCGVYQENFGREFELKQECRCYIIDDLNSVDLGNPDPTRLKSLVEVRAPFVGTILVEKNAILSPQGQGQGGPQILKG